MRGEARTETAPLIVSSGVEIEGLGRGLGGDLGEGGGDCDGDGY